MKVVYEVGEIVSADGTIGVVIDCIVGEDGNTYYLVFIEYDKMRYFLAKDLESVTFEQLKYTIY